MITVLHELCHWAAFQYYGIDAEWTLEWVTVGDREVYPFAAGGLCYPVVTETYVRMSWLEDAVVSLAPLVLTAAGVVIANHAAAER